MSSLSVHACVCVHVHVCVYVCVLVTKSLHVYVHMCGGGGWGWQILGDRKEAESLTDWFLILKDKDVRQELTMLPWVQKEYRKHKDKPTDTILIRQTQMQECTLFILNFENNFEEQEQSGMERNTLKWVWSSKANVPIDNYNSIIQLMYHMCQQSLKIVE